MVVVPPRSLDPVKVAFEHDLLMLVGRAVTVVLLPLLMWLFVSTHNELEKVRTGLAEVHEQVAVLTVELRRHVSVTAAEFDAAKSQIRANGLIVQGLRTDAGELLKHIALKTAARTKGK